MFEDFYQKTRIDDFNQVNFAQHLFYQKKPMDIINIKLKTIINGFPLPVFCFPLHNSASHLQCKYLISFSGKTINTCTLFSAKITILLNSS